MTIHVTIDEATKRLSELVQAAERGEEVVFAEDGSPRARLTMISAASATEIERLAAKRRAAIGMFEHLVGDREINILDIKANERWDERSERKFGDLA